MTQPAAVNGLQENHRKAFVGNVDEYAKGKGWFFGAFMAHPALRSNLVEVPWQRIPNLVPAPEQAHFHQASVEINVVVRGSIELTINQTRHRLTKGQCYVIWPETTVSDLITDDDTELIVIRAPSIPDDKVAVYSP
ncbi:MAG: cupin domain-containing protein [Terriglobales bacterium]